MAEKWFPIQSRRQEKIRVPWSVAEKAYAVYSRRYGNGQSLERLAERGGFGVVELISLLADYDDSELTKWLSDYLGRFPEEVAPPLKV